MKNWLTLFIILAAFACNSHDKTQSYTELIKGDWVTTSQNKERGEKLIFSFEDSVCSLVFPFADFTKYSILNDSLLVTGRQDQFGIKIILLTKDSLVLFAKSDNESVPDTIRLSKIAAKNSISPDTIYFASSGCYGSCPSMFLEIDSSGKFIFLGNHFTKKDGGFKGQLNKEEYNRIIDKIRNLALDSLHEHYEAMWSDDQTCGILISAGKKKILSSAYGFSKEPPELRILFHKLMEVYKTVDLKPYSYINEEYFYSKLNQRSILYPVLPPKIEPPRLKLPKQR